MISLKKVIIAMLTLSYVGVSYADEIIKSSNGNSVIFSQEIKSENHDPNSWGRVTFLQNNKPSIISQKDRYYTEDGTSKASPSGNYLVINSVSGGYIEQPDGTKKYTDRAYCSVVDMKNGCVVSDWDGEACGYSWKVDQDVLSASEDKDADSFDFLSMKPLIDKVTDSLSSLSAYEINNLLRCDVPNKTNINRYQSLLKENSLAKISISANLVDYLNGLETTISLNNKIYLYSDSNERSKTKSYLISGDKVKVIQESVDKQWVNVGYVNQKGAPLITWIKNSDLKS